MKIFLFYFIRANANYHRLKSFLITSFFGIVFSIYSSMHAYQQWTEHERRNSLSEPCHPMLSQSHSESYAQRLESWAFELQLKVHVHHFYPKIQRNSNSNISSKSRGIVYNDNILEYSCKRCRIHSNSKWCSSPVQLPQLLATQIQWSEWTCR